jgi:ATP-dependent helicase/nuclease subunit A
MSNVISISSHRDTATVAEGFRPEPGLSDAEARHRALDTESSCIVEAPAGSGKTGLLMQRLLKLLAHPSVSTPEEVLAITFTKKATAELRHRVLEQLQLAPEPPPPGAKPFDLQTRVFAQAVLDRDRQLGWNLLDRPQRLNIRTIDSVAGEIARSLPLLSGAGGQGTPTESAESLYREAARRTLRQLGSPDKPTLDAAIRTVLLHRDGNLADCESLLARMLQQREQWGELIPLTPGTLDDATLDREVRPRLERSLEAIVCVGLSRALHAIPPRLLRDLTAFAARLGIEPGYKGDPSPIAICAAKHLPPEAAAAHLDHWLALIGLLIKPSDGQWRAGFSANHIKFALPRADRAWLRERIDEIEDDEDLREALHAVIKLPPPRFPDDQWIVARALFHLLRHSLAELKVLFAERAECDFAEVALSAREALQSNSDFVSTTGTRLQHLLVDEMQDTSAGQYELIHLLTQSWDGHSQTLFLVGDPKQSIYLFRQARVERFLRTMREARLGDIPLAPLRLSANFRTQATLVTALNRTFTVLLPSKTASENHGETAEVPFTEATPTKDATDHEIEWHLTFPPEDPETGEPLTGPEARIQHERNEALTIRRRIEEWRKKPLPPGRTNPWSIAVLARNRNHLTAIIREFNSTDHGAPIRFCAVDIDSLAERPEVLDALALIRALLHPADRIAWLATLHSPHTGLGLADLLALTGEGPEAAPEATIADLIPARLHLLSAEGKQLLSRSWSILGAALANLGRAPLSTQAERTWRSLGADAPLTTESRTNVQRVFAILRELESVGPIDLNALNTRIARLYSQPPAGDFDVELMTIHKAKGLEWDVVIIPGLERQERISNPELLHWLELDGPDDEAHILLAPIWRKGETSDKLNQWMKSVRTAREAAERKRLFYVACTRAREELHLFAATKLKANGDLATPAPTSLLKTCWPVAQPLFQLQLELTLQTPDEPSPVPAVVVMRPKAAQATFAFAAGAAAEPDLPPPLIHRLPMDFDPLARFNTSEADRLPYPAAADLPQAPAFDRPEGSFAVRAFGNVVHRYLQLLSTRLEAELTPEALLAELPSWEPRLTASLRGEGLVPSLAVREASRAVRFLISALRDATGRWILAPHATSTSEHELVALTGRTLRADRIFIAGSAPGLTGSDCVWIVDFKTTEVGSRSADAFAESEIAKYRPQLQSYAEIYRSATAAIRPIHLGLYYPGTARFLHWAALNVQLR